MAKPTPPTNDKSIDDLQSIQSHLFDITEQYKEWNKLAGTTSFLSRQTASSTTELNKLINKSLDITSKIGKELVNQKMTKKLIASIDSESRKLLAAYQKSYRGLTDEQRKQVDLLGEQQKQFKALTTEADILDSKKLDSIRTQGELFNKLIDLEKAGLYKSQESLDIQKQFEQIAQVEVDAQKELVKLYAKKDALQKDISSSYKNQAISTALVQKAQSDAAKEVLDNIRSLPKEVEKSNKALRGKNFFTELFRRIPIAGKWLEDAPRHMEEFGVKGFVALGAVGLIAAGIGKIIQLMFKADKQVTDIQKQFSLSRTEANGLRQEFFEIAANAGKFADLQKGTLLTEEDIFNAQMDVNKAFGTAVVLSAQQLTQLVTVKDLIGLSEEAMKGLMTYSLGSSKSIQDIDRAVLGTSRVLQAQSGIQLNNKEILEEAYKITGGIRANFKGDVSELAKAVTQAKLLGTSLENVQKTSEYLLDFESSIESELEAELLLGKQLNLERARAAALTGDVNTVMQEVTNQAGDFDKFMKYNVIQQAALAKAFGYSRDELSDMLFNQKAIEGLRRAGNREENKSLTQRYQQLVKEGHSREELGNILGKEAEQRLETQSAQDRFNKALQKLEDIFSRLVDGGLLQKVITGIASWAEHLSSGGNLFGILTNSEGYQQSKANVAKQLGEVHDSVISPKGEIMISTPRGQIRADSGDSVITTTNPGSLLGGSGNGSNRGVEAKLDQVIMLLAKGGNVYMDSKKVGTTQALGYSAYK